MAMLTQVKAWFAYRKVIRQTTEGMDVNIISTFLEKHPEQQENVLFTAKSFIDDNALWYALLLCLGLIRANVIETIQNRTITFDSCQPLSSK